jgi:hypothetical protein
MKIHRPKKPSSRPSSKGDAAQALKPPRHRGADRAEVHVSGALSLPEGPFSRQIEVSQAEDKALRMEITATQGECDALAQQDDLPAISQLKARFEVTTAGRGIFLVTGEVRARVTQTCVVSLDLFETDVVQAVELSFASPQDVERAEAAYAKRHEEDPDAADIPEPPDPIINGRIDLGAVAAEQLVLGLDPYPRKPGAEFPKDLAQVGEIAEVSPFAALAKLRKDATED